MKKIDQLLKKLSEKLETALFQTNPRDDNEHILAAKIWYRIPIALRPRDKIEIELLEGRYQLTKIFRDEEVIWEKPKENQ